MLALKAEPPSPSEHGPSLSAPVDAKHANELKKTKPVELVPDSFHRNLWVLDQG